MEVSAEYLRKVLNYDPDTGVFTWLAPASNRVAKGTAAGTLAFSGYIVIGVLGKQRRAHRLAWLYMTGNLPHLDIDHIDRNRTNNRFSNLRLASMSQNIANGSRRIDNKSGVRGVYWRASRRRWVAEVRLNGRNIYIGMFKTLEEARAARQAGAQKHYGEYANVD